jgi:hypothetical protein
MNAQAKHQQRMIMKKPTTIKTASVSLRRFALACTMGAALGIGNAGATAPANDDFANAIELTGTGSGQTGDATAGTQTGTDTIGATFQTGEPVCRYGSATNTVWFKWTCVTDGSLTVSTTGSTNSDPSEWDAVLGIYTGASLDTLTALPPGTAQDTGYDETKSFLVTSYRRHGGHRFWRRADSQDSNSQCRGAGRRHLYLIVRLCDRHWQRGGPPSRPAVCDLGERPCGRPVRQ